MLLNSLIFLENITTKFYPWVKCALPQLWWVEWILKVGNLQLKSRVMAVSFFSWHTDVDCMVRSTLLQCTVHA